MIEVLLQAESALQLGLLDRAEILYREVAGADPRNSIAVVGLARVALERDDEPEALRLARRALTIDAENAAAQRMVQRLEEVIAFRNGGASPQPADEQRPSVAAEPVPLVERPSLALENPPIVNPPARAPRRSIVERMLRRR
jgi:tetratricopeptide (TPR) repeat protein